jgi:hypothetical protein
MLNTTWDTLHYSPRKKERYEKEKEKEKKKKKDGEEEKIELVEEEKNI